MKLPKLEELAIKNIDFRAKIQIFKKIRKYIFGGKAKEFKFVG